MDRDVLTRRRVLTGVGAAGVAAFAGLGAATRDSVRYTYASTHECDDATLTAEWRETYTRNGTTTLLENTTADADAGENTGTENTADEPAIINLQNVLPEDRGTISVRITAESFDGVNSVTPTLDLVLDEAAENELIDPEGEAGDSSENTGELQEFLDVKLWKDEGLLGVDALGADNIENDIGEPTIAEGTLQEVTDTVDGESLGTINNEGGDVSIAFRWGFTDESNINITQTDSVTFTFDVGCS